MKLAQLEALVASLRAHAGSGNPDITFYKARMESDGAVLPNESQHFVEFDITPMTDIPQTVWEHKVVATCGNVRAQKGDFNLPVSRIPFYINELGA